MRIAQAHPGVRGGGHEVAARWTRLGVLFNVTPADATPDLERLLLETVRVCPDDSRLFVAAASWLVHYADCVAKRRLAVLIRGELEESHRATMGLLLEWVQAHGHRHHLRFGDALRDCTAADLPGPLFAVHTRGPALRALAAASASQLSRRWGRWIEEFAPRDEVVRPPEWVARWNPSLAVRALCAGDLVASIYADALAGDATARSESELARRYGASRAAIRDALLKLKLAGYAEQTSRGRARPIVVLPRTAV